MHVLNQRSHTPSPRGLAFVVVVFIRCLFHYMFAPLEKNASSKGDGQWPERAQELPGAPRAEQE